MSNSHRSNQQWKKAFKGVEMTTAKWNVNNQYLREQQDLSYPAARFKEKGCFLVWGGDALKPLEVGCIIRTGTALSYHLTWPLLHGMPSS